jgi:hypothetical protein
MYVYIYLSFYFCAANSKGEKRWCALAFTVGGLGKSPLIIPPQLRPADDISINGGLNRTITHASFAN